jgi:hypothetical protein
MRRSLTAAVDRLVRGSQSCEASGLECQIENWEIYEDLIQSYWNILDKVILIQDLRVSISIELLEI